MLKSLNQFALIILISDDANAARAWIEQTQDARGVVPVVAIASAQAAPLIQPDRRSLGQVAGDIRAVWRSDCRTTKHWPSRHIARILGRAQIGMLLALIFTLGGGFVNWGLGLRKQPAVKGGK